MNRSAMPSEKRTNFIREIVKQDLKSGKWGGRVHTRFPPEPNGYLHIGHAKAICLDFGLAEEFGGKTNLRFDDTNPIKEEEEYIRSIIEDVHWLGFDWEDRLYFASDYFEQMYEYAEQLIRIGKAYVDDLPPEKIREYRGTLTTPGKNSPYRDRPVEENLDLFRRMRAGEFEDGSRVLRAKIDMSHPNMNMRDPVIYRILHARHHRTGDSWCIYPMYDWAHGLEDSIERITHSLCTLEFEDHRPLYDWFLDQLGVYHPQQIEFAPLNLTYTVMSKRKLKQLVVEGLVDGWDDPRLPTLSGLRRRGYSPEAIRAFSDEVGVAKKPSLTEIELLEHCLRTDLNQRALRVMVVLNPLKVTIRNYPEDQEEWLEADNNPERPEDGTRQIPFGRELWIERDDFREEAPRKYFRLAPGREVRLKHAYYITCVDVVKDEQSGEIQELICEYDPETKGGWSQDGRKVKGTLHWVSARHAQPIEVRHFDHLFTRKNPNEVESGKSFLDYVNPDSLTIIKGAMAEPSLAEARPGMYFQFLRQGYYSLDGKLSTASHLVFNRSVSLRDSWGKKQGS
ncbi:MAG: glutamine--tRNA ligase/YqeY domain fusion protein [Candidatus Neomarinimicrobiota bacterium]|nr:MAG: glutamine--tRNA ligase/YqeY domain fusion protein [Candidatus Neomarinimicrobiota bacterium]